MEKISLEIKKKRLLFIYPGGLGDVLLLIPTLELIRRSRPDLSIDLLLEKRAVRPVEELFKESENLGFIHKIKSFDFKSKSFLLFLPYLIWQVQNYDLVIATGRSILSALLLWFSAAPERIGFKSNWSKLLLSKAVDFREKEYFAKSLLQLAEPLLKKDTCLEKEPSLPTLVFSEQTFRKVAQKEIFLALGLDSSQFCLIHPGVSQISLQKQIYKSPSVDYWVELIRKLILEQKEKVLLVGGKEEEKLILNIKQKVLNSNEFQNSSLELAQKLLTLKNLKIIDLAYLIKKSKCLICTDSGPMHISLALRQKTLVVWGPTDPIKLLPDLLVKQKLVQICQVENLLCSPCLWSDRSRSCILKPCVSAQEPVKLLEIYRAMLAANC